MSWTFRAAAWKWDVRKEAGWVFVTLPPDVTDELDEAAGPDKAGFGSVRVAVRVGTSSWSTSVFPDTARGGFVLPLKKAVRDREGIEVGTEVEVLLDLERPDHP